MGKRYKDSLQPLGDKIEENQLYVNHRRVEIIFSYLWKGDGMQIDIKFDCLFIIWWNSHIWHLFCKLFICHKFVLDIILWFLSSKLYFWQIVRINSGFPANNHSILPQSAKSLWELFRFSHWKVNLCNSLKTVRESFTKTFSFPPKKGKCCAWVSSRLPECSTKRVTHAAGRLAKKIQRAATEIGPFTTLWQIRRGGFLALTKDGK